VHSAVPKVALYGIVLQIAITAMKLQAAIDNVKALAGGGGGEGGH
jgi:hypothetical protein